MPEGEFEKQPATKRDIAELRLEVIPKLDALEERMERVENTMATKEDMKAGFRHLEEIFKGPEGFGERLERVEKRVGLKI